MNNKLVVPQVSKTVWKNLLKAAFEFYQLKAWNILSEEEIFGVYDSAAKSMGYVCMVGTLGEIMGMFVYRGTDGLEKYRKVLKAKGRYAEEIMYYQDCLCVQLARGSELEPEDKAALSIMDEKIDWNIAPWPQFRSYLPLYAPWFITEQEALYLTAVLRCSVVIVGKIISGAVDLKKLKGKCLTCYPEEIKDTSLHFKTLVEDFPKKIVPVFEPLNIDESKIANIKAELVPQGIFESDVFIVPGLIADKDRPYCTRMVLTADAHSGFVFHPQIISPEDKVHQKLSDSIISAISEHNIMPEEIHVRHNNIAEALQPLGQMLDIKIIAVKNLPAVNEFVRGIENFKAGSLSRISKDN